LTLRRGQEEKIQRLSDEKLLPSAITVPQGFDGGTYWETDEHAEGGNDGQAGAQNAAGGGRTTSNKVPELVTRTFQLLSSQNEPLRNKFPLNADGTILHSEMEGSGGDNFGTGELFPGNLVKVCLTVQDAAAKTTNPKRLCTFTPIDVQRVLFNRAWLIPNPSSQAESANERQYVVFGALASDSLNGVSETN
jgi:hypothetical protein